MVSLAKDLALFTVTRQDQLQMNDTVSPRGLRVPFSSTAFL